MRILISSLVMFALWPGALFAQEPIVRTKLDEPSVVAGQPVRYNVTVLTPTWFLDPPKFPNLDVPNLQILLPERSTFPVTEKIEGENWSGISRTYQFVPMAGGEFEIGGGEIRVKYAEPGSSQPIDAVLPMPKAKLTGTIPAGAEKLDPFIAANKLTIDQKTEGKTVDIRAGDIVVQTVTVKIDGASALFIPPIVETSNIPGLSIYPEEPVVSSSSNRGVISGQRVEKVSYVVQYGGKYSLPSTTLDWFNLETGKVESAPLPGLEITALGEPPVEVAPMDWRKILLWTLGSGLLLLTAFWLYKHLSPHIAAFRKARREQWLDSEKYAYQQAQKAVRTRDLGETYSAIDRWRKKSGLLRESATAENQQLLAALATIGSLRFGSAGHADSGQVWREVSKALESARKSRLAARSSLFSQNLPALNPGHQP